MTVLLGVVLPWSLVWVIHMVSRNQNTQPVLSVTESAAQTSQPTISSDSLCVSVKMADDTVQIMSLDDYVTAVVLAEMPAQFEQEALKAQAVATRTYTLRQMESGKKHPDSDVCVKASCCQAYLSQRDYYNRGGTEADYCNVQQAVAATSCEVLRYEGALVEATYFSCSGGMTEDAQAVWGGDYPYLIAQPSPGEEAAQAFTDTITLKIRDFLSKLELDDNAGYIVDSITYTSGNGVDEISICGKTFSGVQIRQLLGLRSTSFRITPVGENVVITTKGYGHRVGMSQYGAEAMAVSGSDYRQILSYYYPGTELSDL